ncbi:MAG: polymer-forming cytoskeletal protein [Desulfobacterales bacterium]|jgi:cytoskeletal protein CcmA (bactofilin family)
MRLWPKKANDAVDISDGDDLVPSPGRTILGSAWQIKGRIYGKGQVVLKGTFEGELEIQGELTIDPRATVKGTIRSEESRIRGVLKGDLECKRMVTLETTARVEGTLTTARLQVQDGARFKGRTIMENRHTSFRGQGK